MHDYIHVVPDAQACASILAELQAGRQAKQPAYSLITWNLRVDRLLEILTTLPRTKALEEQRVTQHALPIPELEARRD